MTPEEDTISELEADRQEEPDESRELQEVLQQLRSARLTVQPNVRLHLISIERLMRAQSNLLRNERLLRSLDFELLFDVLFDYGRDLTPFRDELHVFAAALDWLCYERYQGQREQFSEPVMKVVRFERMSTSQLRAAFELVSRMKLTPILKHLLQQTQKRLIAQNLLHHSLVFIECPKI
jgi:transposase